MMSPQTSIRTSWNVLMDVVGNGHVLTNIFASSGPQRWMDRPYLLL